MTPPVPPRSRRPRRWGLRLVVLTVVLALPGLWLATPWLLHRIADGYGTALNDAETAGGFGDQFGAITALFTAFAVGGAFLALYMQREELKAADAAAEASRAASEQSQRSSMAFETAAKAFASGAKTAAEGQVEFFKQAQEQLQNSIRHQAELVQGQLDELQSRSDRLAKEEDLRLKVIEDQRALLGAQKQHFADQQRALNTQLDQYVRSGLRSEFFELLRHHNSLIAGLQINRHVGPQALNALHASLVQDLDPGDAKGPRILQDDIVDPELHTVRNRLQQIRKQYTKFARNHADSIGPYVRRYFLLCDACDSDELKATESHHLRRVLYSTLSHDEAVLLFYHLLLPKQQPRFQQARDVLRIFDRIDRGESRLAHTGDRHLVKLATRIWDPPADM